MSGSLSGWLRLSKNQYLASGEHERKKKGAHQRELLSVYSGCLFPQTSLVPRNQMGATVPDAFLHPSTRIRRRLLCVQCDVLCSARF
jgi:hypothetical protein